MEKRKRWQKFLIIGVVILTIYNILPTVFFYAKPLKNPIQEQTAVQISSAIIDRINSLEKESIDWLVSFCKLLKIKPQSLVVDQENPEHIILHFKNNEEANKFRKSLPRAGSLISFVPKQLSVCGFGNETSSNTVIVQRKIPLRFQKEQKNSYFQYAKKFLSHGEPTSLYKALVFDRILQLGITLGGTSENASLLQTLLQSPEERQELTFKICQDLLAFAKTFGENSEITKRYFASFSQINTPHPGESIQKFIHLLEQTKDHLKIERITLQSENQSLKAKGSFLETSKQQRLEQLTSQEKIYNEAETLVKKNKSSFSSSKIPWNYLSLGSLLEESFLFAQANDAKRQVISLEDRNCFIHSIIIDWDNQVVELNLYQDVLALKNVFQQEGKSFLKDQVEQFVYNEIAFDARKSGEKILPAGQSFHIKLQHLEGSDSFLAFHLTPIAKARSTEVLDTIKTYWHPKHPDLAEENFPIWDYETFLSLPEYERKLGLVVYTPSLHTDMPPTGFKVNSIYVIAKGLDKIIQKIQASSDSSSSSQQFFKDFQELKTLLQNQGFFGYAGNTIATNPEYLRDFIFESEDYYLTTVKATREDFSVLGTKRHAVLEFSNVEQRLLTDNKIDNKIHEDLLKWRDDYHAAQVSFHGANTYDVPKPIKNPLLENLKLSLKKYFRGDDRKIIHWGLDLSGGKTVQIELRDHNNRPVTNDADLKQGINELFQRVNKMGVSEVSIRKEGNLITLDFPGSQGLSANELIKSSSMYFHIVNEKFNERNSSLAQASNQFLQDIWNEAVVTGSKSVEEINRIAWRHLHGDSLDPDIIQPRSEAARILYENGLGLANPHENIGSNIFNDAICSICMMRGEDFTEWYGQTHPLLIIFRNFALEGANLKNIHSGYDPSKGNFLVFEIKGKETLPSGEKIYPCDDLYSWTSQFSKDKIAGTPNSTYSSGEGWRMAVILNNTIITAPTLSYPIRDGGSIEGNFTQREMNQLEADLKAGSLTFTPRILSEKNVSPELGSHERNLGVVATCIALALVILSMVAYYRFGGFIASIAVILNLLLMWATLQNLGATLTLASIAGIILTLGMAVDANVLVFERIREEFTVSGRLASAVHTGYRKAFSAILDSNVTTIIAAIILLQFDSGPIRGLALTLIIGIISSMFTALFMTRYFFSGWVQNPRHNKLNMMQFIKTKNFNFMKFGKLALYISLAVILVGGYAFIQKRHTMLGMDFTGGYALNVELKPQSGMEYREIVEKAFLAQGATFQDFQIRQLTPNNHLRIFLSKSMQQSGKPFYKLPLHVKIKDSSYAYENNPRVAWIVNSLNKAGLEISPETLKHLDQNWSEISGQLSDSMRNSALIGLAVALLCILVYITIRFEFKYAICATICLIHDVFFTVAVIAVLHTLRIPIQIDLNTIAAIMTIVGYSLNDTIIVFDRIREDLRLLRKASFVEVINHALNITLSRTTMTSGTTLLVLIPLVMLGGNTVFGFSLVMIIGVIFGTLSSLFIASPLLNFFHERQMKSEKTTPATQTVN